MRAPLTVSLPSEVRDELEQTAFRRYAIIRKALETCLSRFRFRQRRLSISTDRREA